MYGGSLTEIVEEGFKTYSEEFCKYSLWATCKVLIKCHRQNIIYREVRSYNLVCKPNGEIKLTDFYYSIKLSQQQQTARDKVGTLCWMAPELIKGRDAYDFKIDSWSLGIFALELADG